MRRPLAVCALLLCGCPSGTEHDSKSTPTANVSGVAASSATPTAPTAASATPSASGSSVSTKAIIETNTQGTFGDVRIGVGNIWEEEYTDDAGKKQKGLTAGLWVFEKDPPKDFKLRAHPGKKFTASKSTFEVVRVTQTSVELEIGKSP
jgi:hypothetical protein